MIHLTLEQHLEELCPVCGEKHSLDWKHEYHEHIIYKTLNCNKCDYKISLKLDFITDGTFI